MMIVMIVIRFFVGIWIVVELLKPPFYRLN